MYIAYVFFFGYILDLIFGDPYNFPHPVRFIGNLIEKLKTIILKKHSGKILIFYSFILNFLVVGITFFITFFSLYFLGKINKYLQLLASSVVFYTALSTRCLGDEALKIYKTIKTKDIIKSRKALSYIVGRDTENLSFEEIEKAVIETVAENTVDGILSPIFFFLVGFIIFKMFFKNELCILPGAVAFTYGFKAINTLDSMVGYKNEKYRYIGFASAKIDDVANYIPARLSLVLFFFASFIGKFDSVNAFKIGFRDRKNHLSPNCAYSEGSVAGALGIQLGGTHDYFGQKVEKPTIGDKTREVENEDIVKTVKLMYLTSLTAFFITILVILFLSFN